MSLSAPTKGRSSAAGRGRAVTSIAIPLKPCEKPVDLPEDYQAALRNELDVRYLESLGAAPSKANIALMRKHLPADKCTFTTAWKSRGWVSETLFIKLQDPSDAAPVVAARRARMAAADIGPIDRLPTALHERDAAAHTSADADEDDQEKDALQLTAPSGSLSFEEGQRRFLYPYRHVSAAAAKRERVGVAAGQRPPSPSLIDDEEGREVDTSAMGSSSGSAAEGGEEDEWSVDEEEEGEEEELDRGVPTLPPISPVASPSRKGKYNFTSCDPMKFAPLTEREVLVELAAPLELHTRDILQYQLDFLQSFPFARIRSPTKARRRDAQASSESSDAKTTLQARNEISAPRTARFIGMLALFLYRFHMRERCRQPRDDEKLGALLCAVQQYFGALRRRMMRSRRLLLVALPALLLSVRMAIEALFRSAFKKWWTTIDGRETLRRMDHMIEEMFDPNSYHSHIAALESSMEAIQISSRQELGVKRRGDREARHLATSTIISTALPKAPLVKHRRNLAGATYPSINAQLAKIASTPVRQSLLQAARTKPTAQRATADAAKLVEGMISRPARGV